MDSESTSVGGAARPAGKLRVVFADDSSVVRRAIGSFLKSHPRISSVAVCEDGQSAVVASLNDQPDVVVIDVNMPGMDGLETARILRSCKPDSAIIMTSSDNSSELRADCAANGADAFIPKSHFSEVFDVTLAKALSAANADLRYREHELQTKQYFRGTSALASAGCLAFQ